VRIVLALFVVAAPAAAQRTALPYDATRDLAITGVAAVLWTTSAFLDQHIAASRCRWCDPPGIDSSIRGALKWSQTEPAQTASSALAYGGMPLATLGVDWLISGRDAKVAGTDALIAAEAGVLSGLFGQMVKFAVARERPYVHALDPSQKGKTQNPGDNNVSFYSGHANFTMAVAVASGVCASLRDEKNAWAVWATGVPLALFTGYLRIAADKHYATDVLAGAAMGALFGAAVPLLLHRPDSPATAGASIAVSPQVISLSGSF
jgi:membrane-associated phospholipid phosphatase